MTTSTMQAQPLHQTAKGWTVIVPAGAYFLGDPCYAVLGFGTAWGDGTYSDQDGNQYPVDAGLIGLVPDGLIERDKRAELLTLGRMVTFTEPTSCTAALGVMQFGRIRIDTRDFDDTAEEL